MNTECRPGLPNAAAYVPLICILRTVETVILAIMAIMLLPTESVVIIGLEDLV